MSASRGVHSTSRITASTAAASAGEEAEATRARVSAMCSQVQASLRWYSANATSDVATGPDRPDGRSRMSTA